MVLLFKNFRGHVVIELAVTFAPVENVAIVGRFLSFDIDVSVLGIRDSREGFV